MVKKLFLSRCTDQLMRARQDPELRGSPPSSSPPQGSSLAETRTYATPRPLPARPPSSIHWKSGRATGAALRFATRRFIAASCRANPSPAASSGRGGRLVPTYARMTATNSRRCAETAPGAHSLRMALPVQQGVVEGGQAEEPADQKKHHDIGKPRVCRRRLWMPAKPTDRKIPWRRRDSKTRHAVYDAGGS